MSTAAKNLFDKEEKLAIKKAILNAELDTSGEIRVHIEGICEGEVLDRSAHVFTKLKMDKTQMRNGVLFYLAADSKKFAIVGDAGINKVVPEDFWNVIKDKMTVHFNEGRFADGLIEGIQMTGEKLKKHFPHRLDDINELSDEISFN